MLWEVLSWGGELSGLAGSQFGGGSVLPCLTVLGRPQERDERREPPPWRYRAASAARREAFTLACTPFLALSKAWTSEQAGASDV